MSGIAARARCLPIPDAVRTRRAARGLILAFVLAWCSWPASGADAGVIQPGSELWVARYDGPTSSYDSPGRSTLSPDGSTVFVTGASPGKVDPAEPFGDDQDIATVAYDAMTGDTLWSARHDGPDSGEDSASGVAVSPSGATLYVLGTVESGDSYDWVLIAYDTTDGSVDWLTLFDGGRYDTSISLALAPDGARLFATGISQRTGQKLDFLTRAYDPVDGTAIWTRRYNGPDGRVDIPEGIVLSPDGHTVVVTGESQDDESGYDFVTLAYRASTGATKWRARYEGPIADGYDRPTAIGMGRAGQRCS